MDTLNICLAGAGAFGIKHLDALAKIDGVRVTSLVGRLREPTEEVAKKYGVGHVTTDLAESLARNDVDAVILCTPTQMHASQALACLAAGQARAGRDPACRPARRRRGGRRGAEARGPGSDGRPHPPLQPEPPVGAPAHRRGRAQRPADGRADLLLPPPEHQRPRPAAFVDGPPAVASRGAHGRPVRVAGGGDRRGARDAGAGPPRTRHRDGHVDPAPVEDRGDLHAVAVVQQRRTARARSSATSATPARTSPATTTWSTARSRRSTCRRSTCR